MELQPWNLTVRAVAPAVVAWRRLESGEEMSSGSHFCSEVEVELQQWNLTVRAVAPAAAAWRRLESGEEMSSGSQLQ